MKVLVTVSSKHGGSEGIGEAVARVLAEKGLDTDLRAPETVTSLDEYGAVVIGSGVYAGRWISEAKHFVDQHAEALHRLPVWVFSSGPLGAPPKPDEVPPDGAAMAERAAAREHRVFAGRLERSRLNFGERAIVGMVKAPYGDYRDWSTIQEWSAGIARSLVTN